MLLSKAKQYAAEQEGERGREGERDGVGKQTRSICCYELFLAWRPDVGYILDISAKKPPILSQLVILQTYCT